MSLSDKKQEKNYTINSIITNYHKNYANEFIVAGFLLATLIDSTNPSFFCFRSFFQFSFRSFLVVKRGKKRIGRGSEGNETCKNSIKTIRGFFLICLSAYFFRRLPTHNLIDSLLTLAIQSTVKRTGVDRNESSRVRVLCDDYRNWIGWHARRELTDCESMTTTGKKWMKQKTGLSLSIFR